MPATSRPDRLTRRQLNRATLSRQLLLERASLSPLEAVEHLVGLQAQAPSPPYFALWARLDGVEADDLGRLLEDRQVVRVVLMRGTIFLVSAADCMRLRPFVQPVLDRDLRTNTTYARQLAGLDLVAVATAAREVLADEPLPPKVLGARLAERFADRAPASLAHAARGLLPLVQIPPRGVWGRSLQPTLTTAESWLGRPPDPSPSAGDIVRSYLAAFGPASVADLQTWCGLTGLREVVQAMAADLRTVQTEGGSVLVDLHDAPRPPADTPAPPRLLGPYDNLLLSHADRTRIMSDEDRKRLFCSKNGVFPGSLLVDGLLAGEWTIAPGNGSATVTLTPYRPIPKRAMAALIREAEGLLERAHPDAVHDIRAVAPA